MKKLLMGTACLSLFAIALTIIQMSCSKTTAQSSPTSPTQVSKILYTSQAGGNYKLWTANYDGTNATQINIALPAGVTLDFGSSDFSIYLSPDGQKIFFFGGNPVSPGANSLYSCNIDGSNVLAVKTSSTELLHLYGAY